MMRRKATRSQSNESVGVGVGFSVIVFALAVCGALAGCAAHGPALTLSAAQGLALKNHEKNDELVYATLLEWVKLARDSNLRAAAAEVSDAYSISLLALSQGLDKDMEEHFTSGAKKMEQRALEKIQEVRDNDNADYLTAEITAVTSEGQLELNRDLVAERRRIFRSAASKLRQKKAETLAQVEATAPSAAGLETLLRQELAAISEIRVAHDAVHSYLNRPNWVALILHGGLQEMGLEISLDTLNKLSQSASGQLAGAFTKFVEAGGGDAGKKALRTAVENIGESVIETAKNELSAAAKAKVGELMSRE